MFFTQEDYRKIEKWLLANSIKDTEFAGAATPLKGNETVVLVQNGKNVKTSVKDIVDQFFLLGVSDFLNITDKYSESYISIDQAIQLIPAKARKEGQVITFLNTNGNWEIYQFIGKLNQWNNPTLWNNPLDWEKFIIDSILPDEEDLTKSPADANGNSYLSLKDREYNPNEFSGLGRVILRKNIVEIDDPIYGKVTKNILFQDMIAQSNTIYEIRYDFDLNGKEINIPKNCILKFEGGSLRNGSIIGNNTKIEGFFYLNVNIDGTFYVKEINECNFIDYSDDGNLLTSMFSLANKSINPVVVNLSSRIYNLDLDIPLSLSEGIWNFVNKRGLRINGNNCTLNHLNDVRNNYTTTLFMLDNCSDVVITQMSYVNNIEGYDKIVEYSDYYIATLIGFKNGGSNIEIDVYVKNVSYGIKNHFFQEEACVYTRKLKNCRFYIEAENARFPVAIDYLSDSEINIVSDGVHRALYLGGADNCKVNVKVNRSYISPILVLLTDFRYRIDDTIYYKTFSNLDVNVLYTGLEDNPIKTSCVGFQSYDSTYYNRTNRYNIHDINITSTIVKGGCSNVSAMWIRFEDPFNLNDSYENINISAYEHENVEYTSFIFGSNCYAKGSLKGNIRRLQAAWSVISDFVFSELNIHHLYLRSGNLITNNSKINNFTIYKKDTVNDVKLDNSISLCIDKKTTIESYSLNANTTPILVSKESSFNSSWYWYIVNYLLPYAYISAESFILSDHWGRLRFYDTTRKKLLNVDGFEGYLRSSTTNNRPTNITLTGTPYYDTTLKRKIYWNGDKWVTAENRTPSSVVGSTASRPTNLVSKDNGYQYFDADLNIPIWAKRIAGDGTVTWINAFGDNADFQTSGMFSNKPNNPSIGYSYFCTDRQTTEGTTNGIIIYHKGNNVWIDALGRVVS